jgi:hypothetical protein
MLIAHRAVGQKVVGLQTTVATWSQSIYHVRKSETFDFV